jgi:hypothetical protein
LGGRRTEFMTAKKGVTKGEIEREAELWAREASRRAFAEGGFDQGYGALQYARGLADGLRQALEIIAREE